MAVNKPVGDNARKGAVRKRSQLKTKTMGKKHLSAGGEPGSEWSIMARERKWHVRRAETASFLCRDEDEVREKMKQLGLLEQPGKRRVVL